MPQSLRLVLGSLLVLAGLALIAVAVLGARSRLRRNAWVGVRTETTLSSHAAFVIGNRAAAAPAGAAGAVAVAGGAVLLSGADGALGWVVLAVAVVGTLGLAGVAGVVGDRAATSVPQPAFAPSGCSGTCAGCDLVAGCRDTAAGVPSGAEQG
ncbi:SdpI family protein [Pseudonocardia xinjiangensis]|uniref:SdpI family protein n=1 Tax=Pseudonocardia xinjiangensis TaxID=75289 RepID=UPI003D91AF31